MKRMEKINRLVAVNFSATELSRMNNALLDTTYEAARPLMKAHREEVDRVMQREQRRGKHLKSNIAHAQHQLALEEEWNRNYSIPPICTLPEAQHLIEVRNTIQKCEAQFAEHKAQFRLTGDHSHAQKANEAATTLKYLREELAEAGGGK